MNYAQQLFHVGSQVVRSGTCLAPGAAFLTCLCLCCKNH